MVKVNYHIHTTGSDGKLTPEGIIKLAIEKKFDIIGITDHYFFPKGFREWGNEFYSDKYYKKLCSLKRKYKHKIKVLVNAEFDWIEDYNKWIIKETKKRKYDYKFISVHFIKINNEYFPINHSEKLFRDMIKKSGGIKNLVKNYYLSFKNAINSKAFDVVAHIDLIKIWNKNYKYFKENESWYQKEINAILKLIKKMKMKIDLNTSGFRNPCAEQYPSVKILKIAKKMKIPTLIGTDAHNVKEIDSGLDRVYELIKYV